MKFKLVVYLMSLQFTLALATPGHGVNNVIFKEQLKNANNGSVISQKNIGAYYYFGYDGVPQDYKKSFEWFEKAANEDNQQSQEILAYMYIMGQYVKKDNDKALMWNSRAIDTEKRLRNYYDNCVKFRESKVCEAQVKVLPSWKKQVEIFNKNLKLAEQGNSKSQYVISRSYLYGEGVEINSTNSISWLMKSAYNKNSLAAYNLATLFFLTKGVGSDFLEFMEIAESEKDEDAVLIMKLIRLDEKNYHLENYKAISELIRPFIVLKY